MNCEKCHTIYVQVVEFDKGEYPERCDSDDEGAFPIYRHPKAEAR